MKTIRTSVAVMLYVASLCAAQAQSTIGGSLTSRRITAQPLTLQAYTAASVSISLPNRWNLGEPDTDEARPAMTCIALLQPQTTPQTIVLDPGRQFSPVMVTTFPPAVKRPSLSAHPQKDASPDKQLTCTPRMAY